MIYPNAPIREAVLDIKVSGLESKTFEDFKELFDPVKNNYPETKRIDSLKGSFVIKADNKKTEDEITSDFHGVIFYTKKQNKQVQYRRDGFTYNFLAPYTNWEEFKSESKRLWDMYLNKFPEIKIERMALRYINRIVIPRPFGQIEEFVTNVPPIPKELPQIYNSFFSQIEVPCDQDNYATLINTTIETANPKEVALILDIDVYKTISDDFDFDDFDYIRNVKNSIFENCITNKTRELFK